MEQTAGPLESDNTNVVAIGKPVDVLQVAKTPDDVLDKINALGNELRELILQAKRIPRLVQGLDAHQEPSRCVAIAQSHLQTGFMWLRRAVTQPKEF